MSKRCVSHSDAAVIKRLGVSALARALNCSPQRVSNWRIRGIPARVKLENPLIFVQGKAA